MADLNAGSLSPDPVYLTTTLSLTVYSLYFKSCSLNSKDTTILPHPLPERQQHALEKTKTTFYSESEVLFDNQPPSYYPWIFPEATLIMNLMCILKYNLIFRKCI